MKQTSAIITPGTSIMTVEAGYQLFSRRHMGLPADWRRSKKWLFTQRPSPSTLRNHLWAQVLSWPHLFPCFVFSYSLKTQVCSVEAAPCIESQCSLTKMSKNDAFERHLGMCQTSTWCHAGRLSSRRFLLEFLFCLPLSSVSSHSNAIVG